MKNLSKVLLSTLIFAFSSIAYSEVSSKEIHVGIPFELKGFKGMMNGKLIAKRASTIVFRVDRIMKTWKGSKAENPKKVVGQTIVLNLEKVSGHHNERIMKNFKMLKNGDQIEVEAFDLGLKTLSIKEWLKKARVEKQDQSGNDRSKVRP